MGPVVCLREKGTNENRNSPHFRALCGESVAWCVVPGLGGRTTTVWTAELLAFSWWFAWKHRMRGQGDFVRNIKGLDTARTLVANENCGAVEGVFIRMQPTPVAGRSQPVRLMMPQRGELACLSGDGGIQGLRAGGRSLAGLHCFRACSRRVFRVPWTGRDGPPGTTGTAGFTSEYSHPAMSVMSYLGRRIIYRQGRSDTPGTRITENLS